MTGFYVVGGRKSGINFYFKGRGERQSCLRGSAPAPPFLTCCTGSGAGCQPLVKVLPLSNIFLASHLAKGEGLL